jgi:CBS domain-containing protein
MLAQDIMSTDVVTFAPDTTISAAAQVMLDRRISGAPVVDNNGTLKGVISEGDLLFRAETGTEHRRSWWLSLMASSTDRAADYVKERSKHVGDVMTRRVVSIHKDTPVAEVAGLLEKHHVKRLPVLEGDVLVGVVSRADVLRALASAPQISMPPGSIDDRSLRTKILKALRDVDGVSDLHVNVVVSDSDVNLWGFADSKIAADALRVAAENVPGIGKVTSNLAIFRDVPT